MEMVKISVVDGVVGRAGWIDREQRILRRVKLFCLILKWWLHVIVYLPKPVEYTRARVSPNVKYGLRVIMMCQL